MNLHSRQNPSFRYQELIQQYQEMHIHGDRKTGAAPEKTYFGRSLLKHVDKIAWLIQMFESKSVLDYGCGKATVYLEYPMLEKWNIQNIQFYDPGVFHYSSLPPGSYDGVICIDVLEHCPEEDLDWILEELFSKANHFVYASIACYPATKSLPNGENAHCTVESESWWSEKIHAVHDRYPQIYSCFTFLTSPEKKKIKKKKTFFNRIKSRLKRLIP